MFQSLDVFRTAYALASHAGKAQSLTARNIANADTPEYKAQHLKPFAETFRQDLPLRGNMRQTRASHITASDMIAPGGMARNTSMMSPNGNSVSLEEEMVASVNNSKQHKRAITIYRHGLSVLRTTMKTG